MTSSTAGSINQPTGAVYTVYEPAPQQLPAWAPSGPSLPSVPSSPQVERLANGVLKVWGQERPDEPLIFPLSDPAKPEPGPVQPQSTLPGATSTNGMPAYPSASDTTYARPTIYGDPSSDYEAAKSPISESWQPQLDGSGDGVVDSNTDSSAAGSNTNHLFYEDVFQYPSESAKPSPSYGSISSIAGGDGQATDESQESLTSYAPTLVRPSNAAAQPVYQSRDSSPGAMDVNFVQTGYQPYDFSWHPQKPFNSQKVEVARVSEPVFPPAPPPSYIIQSKSGYQRAKYVLRNSRYLPHLTDPMAARSKGIGGQPDQPATPILNQEPLRYCATI